MTVESSKALNISKKINSENYSSYHSIVYKIRANSNIYLINNKSKSIWYLIETGDRMHQKNVLSEISNHVNPEEIKIIILTHLHYDHVGNIDLFPNATLYISNEELKAYNENNFGTVLNNNIVELLKKREIKSINLEFLQKLDLKLIKTPGHTIGSICLFLEEQNILFTGDTFFRDDVTGRTDLPTSIPERMSDSLSKLENLDAFICPGHDY